jgi:hypothetical protein
MKSKARIFISLSQLHAATRAVNDRNESGRGACLHGKIEPEFP